MRSKIKICHIAHKLTGKSDGVFTHLKMLFELLDKNQFEQILMYSGNEPLIDSYTQSLGIKVYNIPELNKKLPIKLFFKIFRILKEENVDIIHTHLVKPYIFAGLINIKLKKKLIFNYHGVFILSDFYNLLEKLFLTLLHKIILSRRAVNLWVFPSRLLRDKLINNYGYRGSTRVYYNGYPMLRSISDNNLLNLLDEIKNIRFGYFLVGIIGRVDTHKRIDIALKILKNLVQNKLNVFFAIIGDGDKIEEMKEETKILNISERVKFFGYVPDIKNYFNFFDLILITSEAEGLPFVIWEAMYNGVPVVSSDVGGIKEILEGENCGVVYPFNDLERCVEIITDLYYNREKLKILGENGRKAILEKYNEKQFKQFFEQLYVDLINEK